jgi:N4-gp56 family major capsid protein
MAQNTTTNLSNSVRTQYVSSYIRGANRRRLYDQASSPIGKDLSELQKGSSVQVNYLNNLDVSTSSISEITDVVPQAVTDATASLTPTSRGNAMRFSELLSIQAFTDYEKSAMEKVGDNAMESIEFLAMTTAMQGGIRSASTTRDLLNAGTTTDYCDYAAFSKAQIFLENLKCPQMSDKDGNDSGWVAIMHPSAFYDLRSTSQILAAAEYQDKSILLQHELGKVGAFRVVSSAFSKVFGAAGADNGTDVATTLNGAVLKGAKTILTAGDVSANIAAGNMWTIGTEETGTTHYADNEQVRVTSASTYTLTIVGSGDNGGLRYDHATGAAVRNADSVYPVLFCSNKSLAKIYATSVGEFGQVSNIEMDGEIDQFRKIWWKWYGGYGILNQNWLVRGEYASSLDNV